MTGIIEDEIIIPGNGEIIPPEDKAAELFVPNGLGFRCNGCGKISTDNQHNGWIAVERRVELISFSATLYSAESYEHYCNDCAERGISPWKA